MGGAAIHSNDFVLNFENRKYFIQCLGVYFPNNFYTWECTQLQYSTLDYITLHYIIFQKTLHLEVYSYMSTFRRTWV